MVHRLRRNIPLLKEWGVLGFHDQDEADWAMSGLTTRIVRARLEWDTKADVDAILDDFYAKWFGRGGRAHEGLLRGPGGRPSRRPRSTATRTSSSARSTASR